MGEVTFIDDDSDSEYHNAHEAISLRVSTTGLSVVFAEEDAWPDELVGEPQNRLEDMRVVASEADDHYGGPIENVYPMRVDFSHVPANP